MKKQQLTFSLCLYLLCIGSSNLFAQVDMQTSISTDSSKAAKVEKQFYGYIDMYYVYKMNKGASQPMPSYVYNHNLSNEFAINQAIVGIIVCAHD